MTHLMTDPVASVADRPSVRGTVTIGILVIVLLVGGFVTWAALAPLQSAAIAHGSVNLDTYRKTVQHLEGGIVKDILIREGQDVAKGDILLRLDETQARAKIALLDAQIASEEEQLALLGEEIADAEKLLAKGLSRKSRVLGLHRRRAEITGKRTEHSAQLHAARDVIERATIRAPIAGSVVGLQVHTAGGVIKPGDALLSIVPKDEPLVVEARIDPNDIDIVHKGLSAQVRLTPLNARDAPPLQGHVAWISADRMTDPNGQGSYYLGRIELTAEPPSLAGQIGLYPGMPAEVMILTGERSFLEYVAAPITRSFRRAFREQ